MKKTTYCLCCYLFRPEIGEQGSGDSFVGDEFSNWRKPERLFKHERSTNSAHDQARRNCDALLNESNICNQFSPIILLKLEEIIKSI